MIVRSLFDVICRVSRATFMLMLTLINKNRLKGLRCPDDQMSLLVIFHKGTIVFYNEHKQESKLEIQTIFFLLASFLYSL